MDVPLRGDGSDLSDLGCGVYGATGEVHGVAACCYVLDTFGVDGAGKDGGCYRSVTGHFVGLLYDILDKTSTKVIKPVHNY